MSLSYQVHDLQEQPGYVKSMSDLNDYQSSSFEKRRFEQIVYFPENLPNCNNKNKSSMLPSIPHSGQLPKGAPDYMLTLYQSDSKVSLLFFFNFLFFYFLDPPKFLEFFGFQNHSNSA